VAGAIRLVVRFGIQYGAQNTAPSSDAPAAIICA